MRNLDPGQNQKARVIGNETNVAPPRVRTPADVAIPTAQMTRRRTPRQTGDGAAFRPNEILQVLADGLLIRQIMMMLHQAVEQRFIGGAPYRLDLNRA